MGWRLALGADHLVKRLSIRSDHDFILEVKPTALGTTPKAVKNAFCVLNEHSKQVSGVFIMRFRAKGTILNSYFVVLYPELYLVRIQELMNFLRLYLEMRRSKYLLLVLWIKIELFLWWRIHLLLILTPLTVVIVCFLLDLLNLLEKLRIHIKSRTIIVFIRVIWEKP